jgi:hypothetical protein
VAALFDHPTKLGAKREKLSGAPVNLNAMTPREAIRFPTRLTAPRLSCSATLECPRQKSAAAR